MKQENTLYITLGSRTYEDGDYRCWGTRTDYYKEFRCIKCRKVIGTKTVPNVKFCSNCGKEINGKVEDYFVARCRKARTSTKNKRNRLLKTINSDNYNTVSKQITEIDKNIENIEQALKHWKDFNYKGDLPTGYNYIMEK